MSNKNPPQAAARVTVGTVLVNNSSSSVVTSPSGRAVTVQAVNPAGNLTATIAALQRSLANQLQQAGVPSASTISSHSTVTQPQTHNFKVRVITSAKKYDTYIIRNVKKSEMTTPRQLKNELYKQLGGNLVSSDLDFNIGYMKGNLKLTIHSPEDINDVWRASCLSKSDLIVLWCDKVKQRTEISDDSDLEEIPRKKRRKRSALEDKKDRVESLLEKLKQKHDKKFSTLQYRLWAEVLDAGTWKSLDQPPSLPAFGGSEKRSSPMAGLTNAVTEMAKAMVQQHHTKNTSPSNNAISNNIATSYGFSPAKLANLRSSYLQQMRDLHSLYESGAVTEMEFLEQKAPILEQLKSLKPSSS